MVIIIVSVRFISCRISFNCSILVPLPAQHWTNSACRQLRARNLMESWNQLASSKGATSHKFSIIVCPIISKSHRICFTAWLSVAPATFMEPSHLATSEARSDVSCRACSREWWLDWNLVIEQISSNFRVRILLLITMIQKNHSRSLPVKMHPKLN